MQIIIKQLRILILVAITFLEDRLEHEFCLNIFLFHIENSYTECIMRFISNLIHAIVYDLAVTNLQNTSCFPPYRGQTCNSRALPWCTYMCRVTGGGDIPGQKDSNFLD